MEFFQAEELPSSMADFFLGGVGGAVAQISSFFGKHWQNNRLIPPRPRFWGRWVLESQEPPV